VVNEQFETVLQPMLCLLIKIKPFLHYAVTLQNPMHYDFPSSNLIVFIYLCMYTSVNTSFISSYCLGFGNNVQILEIKLVCKRQFTRNMYNIKYNDVPIYLWLP